MRKRERWNGDADGLGEGMEPFKDPKQRLKVRGVC